MSAVTVYGPRSNTHGGSTHVIDERPFAPLNLLAPIHDRLREARVNRSLHGGQSLMHPLGTRRLELASQRAAALSAHRWMKAPQGSMAWHRRRRPARGSTSIPRTASKTDAGLNILAAVSGRTWPRSICGGRR